MVYSPSVIALDRPEWEPIRPRPAWICGTNPRHLSYDAPASAQTSEPSDTTAREMDATFAKNVRRSRRVHEAWRSDRNAPPKKPS